CCFLLFQKNREVEAARARAAAAEQKREALASETAQTQQRNKSLRAELREKGTEASDNAATTQELQQKLAHAEAEAQNHKDGSEIFRDQAMKEVFTAEARQGVAKGVNALFRSGLAQQLQLNDAQTEALKPLLTQKGTLMWEQ